VVTAENYLLNAATLMTRPTTGVEAAGRAAYLWWALSRAGHHHGYELAPTAGELRHLHSEVLGMVNTLRSDELEKV
jgi:hypothetical protein